MKPGSRALGIAESYRGDESTLAGTVVRADCTVDDCCLRTCTVGGLDATDAVADLWRALDRPDVQYLLLAGIAPAWYNVIDLYTLADVTDRPVISVSFEASQGLEDGLRTEFSGEALDRRIAVYKRQPPRERLNLNDERVWVRGVGCAAGEARDVVRAFTPEGGRPEPLRVARLVARAADDFRRRTDS